MERGRERQREREQYRDRGGRQGGREGGRQGWENERLILDIHIPKYCLSVCLSSLLLLTFLAERRSIVMCVSVGVSLCT